MECVRVMERTGAGPTAPAWQDQFSDSQVLQDIGRVAQVAHAPSLGHEQVLAFAEASVHPRHAP